MLLHCTVHKENPVPASAVKHVLKQLKQSLNAQKFASIKRLRAAATLNITKGSFSKKEKLNAAIFFDRKDQKLKILAFSVFGNTVAMLYSEGTKVFWKNNVSGKSGCSTDTLNFFRLPITYTDLYHLVLGRGYPLDTCRWDKQNITRLKDSTTYHVEATCQRNQRSENIDIQFNSASKTITKIVVRSDPPVTFDFNYSRAQSTFPASIHVTYNANTLLGVSFTQTEFDGSSWSAQREKKNYQRCFEGKHD